MPHERSLRRVLGDLGSCCSSRRSFGLSVDLYICALGNSSSVFSSASSHSAYAAESFVINCDFGK